ncbi:MAG: mandelate racemase, partial [Verrucomicrobia bacterium]|nr:mandelate racemase [Verrucomicrobiota bacterium]
MPTIQSIETRDFRKQLEAGAGSDAVHTDPQYGYGVTLLKTDNGLTGSGIAYTLGTGTNLVCDAIQILAVQLQDRNIEELMAEFGAVQRSIAEHPAVRWLGPHKGVTHLALASITNA